MQPPGPIRVYPTASVFRLLFLGLVVAHLPSCGGSDVPRIRSEDVPCAPYGENRYAGEFSFRGKELSLSVSSAAGQCCVLIGGTLTYLVEELSSTSMTLMDERGRETVWSREAGTGSDIVGLWESGDGQTLAFDPSGSFSGSEAPSCFEPPSCGSLAAAPRQQRVLLAVLPWLQALVWLWLLHRKRGTG